MIKFVRTAVWFIIGFGVVVVEIGVVPELVEPAEVVVLAIDVVVDPTVVTVAAGVVTGTAVIGFILVKEAKSLKKVSKSNESVSHLVNIWELISSNATLINESYYTLLCEWSCGYVGHAPLDLLDQYHPFPKHRGELFESQTNWSSYEPF